MDRRKYNLRNIRRRVSGAVVLELILALPLLVIVLLAIVEFGVMLNNLQYLKFAARTGAQVASQLPAASLNPGPAVPLAVIDAVNTELGNATPGSMTPLAASSILIEHRVPAVGPGAAMAVNELVNGDLVTGADVTEPASPSLSAYRYVRVTVFVDATDLTPNVLAAFGIDLTGKRFQQTTTYAHVR